MKHVDIDAIVEHDTDRIIGSFVGGLIDGTDCADARTKLIGVYRERIDWLASEEWRLNTFEPLSQPPSTLGAEPPETTIEASGRRLFTRLDILREKSFAVSGEIAVRLRMLIAAELSYLWRRRLEGIAEAASAAETAAVGPTRAADGSTTVGVTPTRSAGGSRCVA